MKIIKDFPAYSITKEGQIWSSKSNKFLKLAKDRRGYSFVHIKGESYKNVYAHRQVAKAFLPYIKDKPHVNHKDGNKANNNVNNLEWCTNSENLLHSYQNGRSPNRGNGKLSAQQVQYIRKVFKDGASISAIAREMGLKWDTVSNIVKGRSWTNI